MMINVLLKTKKTMKKYSILLSATLAILALASCQKEQEIVNEETPNVEVIDNTPTSVPFVLRADIPSVNSEEPSGPETKTTLNTSTWAVDWESTDVIYAVTTDEAWGEAYPKAADETIAEFVYDSEKGTFSTAMAIADGSHTFNFLYTAGHQKSFHRGASTTFSLAGTQTFDASAPTASLKLYDALAAQVTATTPTTFADVDMSHLFTLMKVTLKNKTGASVNITKFEIEIPGEDLYGIFDVTFGTTPSAAYNRDGGDKITVNISNGTVESASTLDVYFVMGAVSGYTGEVTFRVTDSADNTYTKTNTISAPGVTFAAGTYNTANYTIKAVDPPMVTSWVETAIGSLAANDVIAIVDKNSSTALGNNNGTSSSPSAISVTISGSNLTGIVPESVQWVFEIPSANTYSFKAYGSSNYLYCTNSNTGIRVGSGTDKTFNITSDFLYNIGQGRYLGKYKDGSDWRSYTTKHANISSTDYGFYKKSSVAATEYTVSVTTPSNGTVTTSPSGKAYETSTVTITATPDDGYAVSAVNVVDGSSNVVSTTPVDATHYTFTMPSDDVTVTVTFARVYTITATATNGSIEVSPATTAFEGETITITATPNSGYAFDSWSVTGATPASTTANPTTFTMPASDVSVIATFAIAKTITRLVASIDDVPAAGVSGEIEAGVYSLTNAVEGDLNVTCDGTVVTDAINDNGSVMYDVAANTGAVRSGWIKIAVAGGNEIEIEVNQLAGTVDYSSTYTSNVTLATGTSAQNYTLTIGGSEYDGIKAGVSKSGGSMTFSIPSGTTRITLHAQGWGSDTPTVSIATSLGTVSPSSFSPNANDEYAGNGTSFNITTSASDYFVFEVTGVTSTATITLSTDSGKNRFVVWGVNVD